MQGMSNFSDKEQHLLHIVMYPWLAHGHISPHLELSKRLASYGVKISFVSSPRNVEKIKPLLDSDGRIHLVELPLPAVEGLPPGAESTSHIENEKIPLLMEAVDRWEEPFHELLQRLSPDYVVYDVVQCWTSRVAEKLGIPSIIFLFTGAASVAYCFSPSRAALQNPAADDLTLPPEGFPSESVVRWRHHEARDGLGFYKSDRSGSLRFADRFLTAFAGCSAVFVNSCYELEGKYIDYLQSAIGKLVLPVGPLVPEVGRDRTEDSMEGLNDCDCLKWLNMQAPLSVVMVSFGSECFLSVTEVRAVALGLEESHAAFLWVLRLPPRKTTASALPEGFPARTGERGLVVEGWAPQLRILSHPSVGGFLTHCGKNAVTEGLRLGLPLVALPMRLEQGLTARLVEGEWHIVIGVEVERRFDGTFSKEDVSRAVRKVMVEEEGRHLRFGAAQIAQTLCTINERNSLKTIVRRLTDKELHIP